MSLLRSMLAFRSKFASRSYSVACKTLTVSINEDTNVATLSLNRPPVNALNLELMTEAKETIEHLQKQGTSGMIITSSLPTVFCAGLELKDIYKADAGYLRAFWTALQDVWMALYGASFPTVAVINGHAPAGGCLLCISCDYRIMVDSPKYTIGLNETKVGIAMSYWVGSVMMDVIGHRQAELALSASRMFHTSEALHVGLVDELVVDKKVGLVKAAEWLDGISDIPLLSKQLTKYFLRERLLTWMKENKEQDVEKYVAWLQREEFQKSIGAYIASLKNKSE